jgi:hypothetical protein
MKKFLLPFWLSLCMACIAILAPAQSITVTPSQTNCHCNGGSDGTATVSATGGIPPYTYSWTPTPPTGQGTSSVTGLSAGTYSVHVTDNALNTGSANITITSPAALSLNPTIVQPTCSGNNGSATMNVTGGTGPYSYTWTPLSVYVQTISGITAGAYTCIVSDNNGCVGSYNTIVTNASVNPTLTMSHVDVACYGASTGSATVTPAGGTPPYTYSWIPGTCTTATDANIPAGLYTIQVTDAAGCGAGNSALVNQLASTALTATLTETDVTCYGGSNGSASVTASGGSGSGTYTYAWVPTGATSPFISPVSANTYTCTVTDGNGCSYVGTTTVNQMSAMVVTTSGINVTCNGGSDGAASVTVTGGPPPPYNYYWSPGSYTTQSVAGLTPGIYTCTATDPAHGCTGSGTITIAQPMALSLSMSNVNVNCYGGSTGSATVTVSGGTPSYTYSWTPGSCTTSTFSNLSGGGYTVTVTDAAGCISGNAVTVTTPPTSLSATLSETDVHCNGGNDGTASVIATGGGGGYTYLWIPSGGATASVSGLTANNYTCTVTDANGCNYVGTTTVNQPAVMTTTVSGTSVSCNGGNNGSAVATVTGGGPPPYSYVWLPSGATTPNVSGLSAGTYTCTATNIASGCTASGTYIVTEPAALAPASSMYPVSCNGLCDGVANASVSGGTVPYTYSWNPGGAISVTIAGQCPGSYTCFITDGNGCVAVTPAVTITQPALLTNTYSANNATCNGCDGKGTAVASGGTTPYTYSWSPTGQDSVTISALCPGTYSVQVTDSKGCTQTASGNITQSASPQITGTVIAPISGPINSGKAYLVLYDSILHRQQVVDSFVISSGRYTFTNSVGKKFLVYAIANVSTYPNVVKTYAGNADQWINATIINAPCATLDTANITMIELTPPSGAGSFSGTVLQAAGYSPRVRSGNPVILAPGDPIPGLDVNLEQHPGGIMAQTTTDAGGNYHFGNIPPGTFQVYVDIPGLGMTSQYTRVITSNQMYINLNYQVDSAHIYPDSVLVTEITPYVKTFNSLSVAPNPFTDQLNITYTLSAAGDAVFEIYNTMGERVASFTRTHPGSGTYTHQLYPLDYGLCQGIYTLRMTAGGAGFVQRIVFIK